MLTAILSEEIEVKATADEAWKVYGTLQLGDVLLEKVPDVFQKIEILEGNGGTGTVLKITLGPGGPGPTYMTEKYKVVDDEKRLKIVEVELGSTKFQIQIKVLEKDENTCITQATVEYEKNEDEASNKVSVDSAKSFVAILNAVADTLTKLKEV